MEKSVRAYLKKHQRSFYVAMVLLVLLIVAIFVLPPFFSESQIVSPSELADYFHSYLDQYSRLVEENMGMLDRGAVENHSNSGSQNLTFYWQRPYNVQGVISKTHGALLLMNRSNTQNMQVSSTADPIEYYIWPNMNRNLTSVPSIRILKASSYYLLDTPVSDDTALIYD